MDPAQAFTRPSLSTLLNYPASPRVQTTFLILPTRDLESALPDPLPAQSTPRRCFAHLNRFFEVHLYGVLNKTTHGHTKLATYFGAAVSEAYPTQPKALYTVGLVPRP